MYEKTLKLLITLIITTMFISNIQAKNEEINEDITSDEVVEIIEDLNKEIEKEIDENESNDTENSEDENNSDSIDENIEKITDETHEEITDEIETISERQFNGLSVVEVNTVVELLDAINTVDDQTTINLTALFQQDLLTLGTTIDISTLNTDSRSITINGNNLELNHDTALILNLFTVNHQGSGVLTFNNLFIKDSKGVPITLLGTGPVVIDNSTIENTDNYAIQTTGDIDLKIINTKILNSTNTAVWLRQSSVGKVVIDNTLMQGNHSAYSEGGALRISSGHTITIKNSSFIDNYTNSYHGGAIATERFASNLNVTISKSYFKNNIIYDKPGGAIGIAQLNGGTVQILDSVFEANKSEGRSNIADGGAIAVKNNVASNSGTITISGNNFNRNIAGDNGGAMLLESTNDSNTVMKVYNNTFYENHAKSSGSIAGVGGAVQVYGSPDSIISHNTFYRNTLDRLGGGAAIGVSGIPNSTTSAKVANNIFIDNKASSFATVSKNHNVAIDSRISANVDNNGNVGYDAGKDFIPDNSVRNNLVKAENIFNKFDGNNIAIPESLGFVGEANHQSERTYYIPNPIIDEMLRTNDPRTVTGVNEDVRGYPRESLTVENPYYPNAGAVEIYWTKFSPGEGTWSNRMDVIAEGGFISLVNPEEFYKLNNPPTFDSNGMPVYEKNLTFKRNLINGPASKGFIGWEDQALINGAHEVLDVEAEYEARKQTYVATWKTNQFHLDFELLEGEALSGHETDFMTQTIIDGQNNNLGQKPNSDPYREGYDFDGWYTSEDDTGILWDFASDQVLKDTTLYAKYKLSPNKYTVTFDSMGGSVVDPQLNVIENSKIVSPTPTRENHSFVGWYKDNLYTNVWDFDQDVVTSDITLYAKWKQDTIDPLYLTVTFESNGGSAITSLTQVTFGTLISKPENPVRSGYKFVGWYKDDRLTSEWKFDSDAVYANMTLYAKWDKIDATVPTGISNQNYTVLLAVSLLVILRLKRKNKSA